MKLRFGVHTGLQHTSIDDLQSLWRRIEELGFDWISIWDHFYAADASGDPHCLEAITAHTALAATTERVTCGSLVYSAGYRHPAVLANAMATLDQVARGRTVLGLGGGWLQGEYDAYGLHYGSPGERLRKWRKDMPLLATAHEDLQLIIGRSLEDLGALRIFDPDFPERAVVASLTRSCSIPPSSASDRKDLGDNDEYQL